MWPYAPLLLLEAQLCVCRCERVCVKIICTRVLEIWPYAPLLAYAPLPLLEALLLPLLAAVVKPVVKPVNGFPTPVGKRF